MFGGVYVRLVTAHISEQLSHLVYVCAHRSVTELNSSWDSEKLKLFKSCQASGREKKEGNLFVLCE